MKTRQTSPYEILCPRCNVTFPVGSRHCIHCGGPLGRGRSLFAAAQAGADAPPEEIEAAEEPPRSSAFSPVALLWAVLIAGGAIYRTCTGG
jgi:hypothetical protein